ncbi:MAG: hypothetical protein R2831_10975 [Chitinophagaceae bacterium]
MDLTFNDRFESMLKELGYNANRFAVELGYNGNKKIQRLIGTSNKPSIDILLDIKNKFSNINIEWLLTGEGDMYKPKDSSVDLAKCQKERDTLFSMLIEKKEEIERLKEEKKIYKNIPFDNAELNEDNELYKIKKKQK